MRTHRPSVPSADHGTHDEALVASLVARPLDLDPTEQAAAHALVERCGDCATLHADLVAVSAALPSVSTPARPRDFTLTDADAARLRDRGIRGLIRWIGSARDSMTRPLALGLTTLGIVGMLVASVPGAFTMGASGAAPASLDTAGGTTNEAAPAESLESLEIDEPGLPSDGDGGLFQGTDAGDRPATMATGDGTVAAAAPEDIAVRDDPTGMSALFVLAGAFTILGFGLFALRWTARRL